jgi:hypothetical protein
MSANNRSSKRQPVEVDGMIYDHHGKQMAPCMLRNISVGGAQVELVQEIELPAAFVLALSHDGHVRRSCHKVWQFATVVGVKFAEKPVLGMNHAD